MNQTTVEIDSEKLKDAIRVICDACQNAKVDRLTGHVAMKILVKEFEDANGIVKSGIFESEIH